MKGLMLVKTLEPITVSIGSKRLEVAEGITGIVDFTIDDTAIVQFRDCMIPIPLDALTPLR